MRITITTDDGEVLGIYGGIRVEVTDRHVTLVYGGDGEELLTVRKPVDDELVRDLVLYRKREENR